MRLTGFGEILWDVFDQEKKIGGAPFNFAAHAVRQGAEVCLISAVGQDELGEEALAACKKLHVPADYIARLSNYPTGKCQVALKDGMPVYDLSGDYAYDHIPFPKDLFLENQPQECDSPTKGSAIQARNQSAATSSKEPSAIYFGTLAQRGDESRSTLKQILTKKHLVDEVFFDINIRQHYYNDELIDESIRAATILKVSREEINVLADKWPSNLKMILVTMDSDGAFVYERDGKITKSKRPSCQVVSTVGAGDALDRKSTSELQSRI